MPNPQSEAGSFLDEFAPKVNNPLDILDVPLTGEPGEPQTPAKGDDATEETDEEVKPNRRQRRLQQQLEQERQASAEVAQKLAIANEALRLAQSGSQPTIDQVDRIYGTDTPEAAMATQLLKGALKDVETRARESALEQFRAEQAAAAQAQAQADAQVDSILEDIEAENGGPLDPATRTAFLTKLERLSPKDVNGNILQYADHYEVWDDLAATRQPVVKTKAKELAARSLNTNGASSPNTTVAADANERFLREAGII